MNKFLPVTLINREDATTEARYYPAKDAEEAEILGATGMDLINPPIGFIV